MLLIQFVCLQFLDVLTTLIFLSCGVHEANPLVRLALEAARGNPAAALLAVKVAGFAAAFYAWRSGRHRLLGRINLLFAVCVAWNLVAITARLA